MSNFNFSIMFPNPETLINYINSGNPLNIVDTNSNTLLLYVCTQILYSKDRKWVNVAMKMLDFTPEQINLGYANPDGLTALILVSGANNEIALQILKHTSEEINLNFVEKNNLMNALMHACNPDSEEVALKMLEFPSIVISLQQININGYTPLMTACEESLSEVALTMIDKFPTDKLNIFQKGNDGKTAFQLALDNDLREVYMLLNQMMDEEERNSNMYRGEEDEEEVNQPKWAQGIMPEIPTTIQEQVIDTSKNGYDPFMLEERNIKDYIDEDKDNIVILYEDKYYLLTKSVVEKQINDGIVFECIKAEGIKNPNNIVENLPLFNIKIIGIDIPTDKTGIWPEFIYFDGIRNIISSESQYFTVIPLVDKMLVSVISLNEATKIGSGLGSAAGSLHCQNGQGGMAGIIIPAKPILTTTGGRRKKRGTVKRKKYLTKTQKRNRRNRFTKNTNSKKNTK